MKKEESTTNKKKNITNKKKTVTNKKKTTSTKEKAIPNKKTSIVNKIFSILMSTLFVIVFIYLYKLGVIPNKYLYVIIGVLTLVSILFIFLSFKVKNTIGKIITFIFMILFSIGSCFGIYYINTTNNLFTNIKEVTEKDIYYIVVSKDSNYSKLSDLNKKSMATFTNQSKNYKKALEEVSKTIEVKTTSYNDMNNIVKDLINGTVDCLLINSNNKELLDENFPLFKDNTKVIDELSITIIKQKEEEYRNKYGPFNILISGIDTHGSINKVSRSDVNIVMTVNPNTKTILLTNIPRDMEVQLHGTTGPIDKLTHAGMYGIDMSRQTLEDFFNIEIPYYIRVNFDSVVSLVDSIGGVDVNNDIAFRGYTRYFAKGNIHLNGKQALEYSRERKKLPGGDWTRGLHQEEVIRGIITKMTTSTELLTNYSNIINNLAHLFQTNIPEDTMKKYVKDQLDTMTGWNIHTTAVGGSGPSYQETYSMPGAKVYVTLRNEESINHNANLINGILKGKKFDEIK